MIPVVVVLTGLLVCAVSIYLADRSYRRRLAAWQRQQRRRQPLQAQRQATSYIPSRRPKTPKAAQVSSYAAYYKRLYGELPFVSQQVTHQQDLLDQQCTGDT